MEMVRDWGWSTPCRGDCVWRRSLHRHRRWGADILGDFPFFLELGNTLFTMVLLKSDSCLTEVTFHSSAFMFLKI